MIERIIEDGQVAEQLQKFAPECLSFDLPSLNYNATGHVSTLEVDTSKIRDVTKRKQIEDWLKLIF